MQLSRIHNSSGVAFLPALIAVTSVVIVSGVLAGSLSSLNLAGSHIDSGFESTNLANSIRLVYRNSASCKRALLDDSFGQQLAQLLPQVGTGTYVPTTPPEVVIRQLQVEGGAEGGPGNVTLGDPLFVVDGVYGGLIIEGVRIQSVQALTSNSDLLVNLRIQIRPRNGAMSLRPIDFPIYVTVAPTGGFESCQVTDYVNPDKTVEDSLCELYKGSGWLYSPKVVKCFST